MADNQFIYAVARIRTKELSLFNKQTIDQLMSCRTYEDCIKLLSDKGWACDGKTAEELLIAEREKTWAMMEELVEDMSVFNVFLYENDFHNLKAAIKEVCVQGTTPGIFKSNGTIDPQLILKAVQEKDFEQLPEYLRACAEEAYEIQLKSRDSQMTDVIIDRAALEMIYKEGIGSGNDVFEDYVRLKVVAADINIAIRGCKTGKSYEFMQKALVPCDTLDVSELRDAALTGLDSIYEYLSGTVYADAITAIKKSPSAFEKWCDDILIEHIKPQKYNCFTLMPLAAYILARENEIKSIRILLSGKLNKLSDELIRERLREMYV